MNLNSTEIGERLNKYLSNKGISLNELGRKANTSGSQIKNVISGKNFTIGMLENILNALPNLNSDWLLFGRGEVEDSGKKQLISIPDFTNTPKEIQDLEISDGSAMEGMAGMYFNIKKLYEELRQCREEKDALHRELVDTQKEMIEILKGKK